MNDLDSFRKEINKIDNDLLRLFVKRMNVAAKIGIVKKAADLPIYVKDRENEVINRLLKKLKKGELSGGVTDFFLKLMEISRNVQMNLQFRNIILTGMPGCGKTVIGRQVADKLGLKFLDIDTLIEEHEGMAISKIFEKGEPYFRKLESAMIEDCASQPWSVISTGGGAVLLEKNIEILKSGGDIYFIDRPADSIVNDVDVSGRPLLLQGKQIIYELYAKRYDIYKNTCDYRIDNSGSLDAAVNAVIDTAAGAAILNTRR